MEEALQQIRQEMQKKVDKANKERDEANKERDEANKERDEAEKERDEAEKERDEAKKERDEAEKERDEAEKRAAEAETKADEAKKEKALFRLECDLRTLSTGPSSSSPVFNDVDVYDDARYPTDVSDAGVLMSDSDVSSLRATLEEHWRNIPSNNSEADTQARYADFLKSVVAKACPDLQVVDTCKRPFPGLGMQPDLIVCEQSRFKGHLFPEMVLGVVELKAKNYRDTARPQIVQRVEELLHFVRQDHTSVITEPFTLHGIIADDVGARWITVTIGRYNEEKGKIPLSRVIYGDVIIANDYSAFINLFVTFFRTIGAINQNRGSSTVDGNRVTRFHLRKPTAFERSCGKAAVYLEVSEKNPEEAFVVKVYPDNDDGAKQFEAEEKNIQLLKNSKASDLVNCFTVDTSPERSIRSSMVGRPLRFRNAKDAKKCFDEIENQLKTLWTAGLFHGDVSPKNIVMLGGDEDEKAEYRLIDFGNAEETTLTMPNNKTVVNRGTMPFTVPHTPNSKELDMFQLGAAVIFTYGFCSYKVGAWWGAKSVTVDNILAARRECLEKVASNCNDWPQNLCLIGKMCISFLDDLTTVGGGGDVDTFTQNDTGHLPTRKHQRQASVETASKQQKKDEAATADANERPEAETEEDSPDTVGDGF